MSMDVSSRDEREEERARQRRVAEELKASGALEGIFAQVDAGAPLTGSDGVLAGVVKAALERGLAAELTEHLGYDRGDPDAAAFPNSRNGTSSKTVSTEVGDVDLDVPRDRAGTFTPMLVPKGQRRLDGLDAMIISLYAGGMTVRDIQHHLASTLGTDLSHETISKITDQISQEVLAWQHRPLDGLYPVIYYGCHHDQGPRRGSRDQQGRAYRGRRGHGRDQARPGYLGPGQRGGPGSGPRCAPSWPTAVSRTC